MKNKIYTVLANIYNELKKFKGKKSSLKSAVKDVVDNSEEVLKARGGHIDLDNRLVDIQKKINSVNIDTNDIYNKISSTKAEIENKIPKVDTAIIHDENKEILVSLDDRVLHKEDILTIPPKGNRILVNSDQYTISKAYINDLDSKAIKKSIIFKDDNNVSYNKELNQLDTENNTIMAKGYDELYELPLSNANIFKTKEYDACIVNNLCKIVCDYCSPTKNDDDSINYTNHLINAFIDNYKWKINRSYVSLVITLNEPIELMKILVDYNTTSTYSNCKIEYADNENKWHEVTNNNNIVDFTLPKPVIAKAIKIIINVFDGYSDRIIYLNNIKIHSTKYNKHSDVITNSEPLLLDYYNNLINIKTNENDNKYIITKYAVNNLLNDDNILTYTYIPKTLNVYPKDFYDSKKYKYIDDELKNNMPLDVASKLLYYFLEKSFTPQTSVRGTLGHCSIHKVKTYSENYAWKPKGNIIYSIYITVNNQEYKIPLHINNINKPMYVTVGEEKIYYKINIINQNVLMVYLDCKNKNIVSSIKVNIKSAYHLNGKYKTSQFYRYNYSLSSINNSVDTLNDKSNISIYTTNLKYRIVNGNWFWFDGWSNTTISSANEIGATACIIPREIYKNRETLCTKSGSNSSPSMHDTFIENKYCNFPVSVYLGCNGVDTLRKAIEKTSRIESVVHSPIFAYGQEYETKIYIDNVNITSIIPQQTVSSVEDIQYAVSFDGYDYYVLNNKLDNWIPYLGQGMTYDEITSLNETIINKIRNNSEWLYIKVKIISPIVSMQNITINFDNYKFALINKDEILDKGMTKETLENINPEILKNTIFNVSPVLYISCAAKALYPCYQYKLSGYDIYNYKDIKWKEIDNINIKEYLIGNNALMYENTSKDKTYVKVIRNIYKNQNAIIDNTFDIKKYYEENKEKQKLLLNQINVTQQNIKLMHDTFINDGTVPSELPKTMLPNVKEYEVPILKPGDIYKISDVYNFRGIQLWEEKRNFIGYSKKLIFNKDTKNSFINSLINIDKDGAVLSTDYDKDNPYMCPENNYTGNSNTFYSYKMFDVTISKAPKYGNIHYMFEDGGSHIKNSYHNWYYGNKYTYKGGHSVFWDLPGENKRYVDIIIDFRKNVYLNFINNLTYGVKLTKQRDYKFQHSNQKTTFSYSLNNKEYENVVTGSDYNINTKVTIQKELRYLKIRLELPYSCNKGKGEVSFTQMDIYFSPVHYVHDVTGYIYNSIPIDTSDWNNFKEIKMDRFIDHNPCEMKFILSDTDTIHWKYWDNNNKEWKNTEVFSMEEAMSIETLLSLTIEELNKLKKGKLYFCALMETTDIWKTPILREVEFIHDTYNEKTYYDLLEPYSLDIKYIKDENSVIIKNTTNANKTLKAVIL